MNKSRKNADTYHHSSGVTDRFAFRSDYGIPRFICYLAVYLVIGYDIVKKAFKGIKMVRFSMKTF